VAAEYLFRLDDACPTMDAPRWDALLKVLASRSIHPIIAIVPDNSDPALVRQPPDPSFWQRARTWAHGGCIIALHGYSHLLRRSPGGLVPVQRHSEFVGLPADQQRQRIRAGVQVLQANGLVPEAWVAPAHGFDVTTLQALRMESGIRVISDGFMQRAVRRDGFVWLPQQLWHPRFMRQGLWTICLHPNELDASGLKTLDAFLSSRFLSSRRGSCPDPRDVVEKAVPYGMQDALLGAAYAAALRIKRLGTKKER
jgi:predicted deacetylase